jgi:hypothetical protein
MLNAQNFDFQRTSENMIMPDDSTYHMMFERIMGKLQEEVANVLRSRLFSAPS